MQASLITFPRESKRLEKAMLQPNWKAKRNAQMVIPTPNMTTVLSKEKRNRGSGY